MGIIETAAEDAVSAVVPGGAFFPIALKLLPWGVLAVTGALAWHFETRLVAADDALRTQATEYRQAQATATKVARQALQQETAAYQAKATEAQNGYQVQLAVARSAADQYIATHGVRGEAVASGASTTIAPAQGGSSGVPAGLSADTVLVSPTDVQICTDAVTYGIKAHDWSVAINP